MFDSWGWICVLWLLVFAVWYAFEVGATLWTCLWFVVVFLHECWFCVCVSWAFGGGFGFVTLRGCCGWVLWFWLFWILCLDI